MNIYSGELSTGNHRSEIRAPYPVVIVDPHITNLMGFHSVEEAHSHLSRDEKHHDYSIFAHEEGRWILVTEAYQPSATVKGEEKSGESPARTVADFSEMPPEPAAPSRQALPYKPAELTAPRKLAPAPAAPEDEHTAKPTAEMKPPVPEEEAPRPEPAAKEDRPIPQEASDPAGPVDEADATPMEESPPPPRVNEVMPMAPPTEPTPATKEDDADLFTDPNPFKKATPASKSPRKKRRRKK